MHTIVNPYYIDLGFTHMFKLLSFAESFNSMLLEDRVEYITNKQGDKLWNAYQKDRGAGKPKLENAAEVVKYLANNISEKHLQKIVNWYLQGDFSLEDASKIKSSIEKFEKLRSKLEKKDLNQYTSSAELDDAITPFKADDMKSNNQRYKEFIEKLFKVKQAEVFYEGGGVKVIIPHTEEASKCFGKGTRWCTAADNDNRFRDYIGDPLYIVITDDGKKYQFHFKNAQFMDSADKPIDLSALAHKYPVLYKIFEKEAKKWGITELIDPKNLSFADVFEKVRKTYDVNDVIKWVKEYIIGHGVKIDDKIKKNLIELYYEAGKKDLCTVIIRSCKGAFLQFKPMELVELFKTKLPWHCGTPLYMITIFEPDYIKYIYSDKKAFQELINFIVDQPLNEDGDITSYFMCLENIKKILGNEYKTKDWVPKDIFDKLVAKYAAKKAAKNGGSVSSSSLKYLRSKI
jgi:hypothetical protein